MLKKKIAIGLAGLMLLSATACSNEKKDKQTQTDVTTEYQSLYQSDEVQAKINEINGYIDSAYYFDIDEETQKEALYDGIMAGLNDPYSVYYTAEEYADLQEDTSGEYFGIGAVVTKDEDMYVKVVRPIPGSPAEEAGLEGDDIIVEVDGTSITDQDLDIVVKMIRGESGTKAKIKIYRPSKEEYMTFEVERRQVENVTVYPEVREIGDMKLGYIEILQFYDNTAAEFEAAIDELDEEGVQGYIIDVRDNPGGLLTAVTEMCSYVMDGGTVVTTKDKNGNILDEKQDNDNHSISLPIVLLINGNSASASEIFAGAIKDTGLGELVGTTTYGKGIVQSIIPLSDGDAIKITIAKYFTAGGNDIHEVGVEPDYVVELPNGAVSAASLTDDEDVQLQKAYEVMGDILGVSYIATGSDASEE